LGGPGNAEASANVVERTGLPGSSHGQAKHEASFRQFLPIDTLSSPDSVVGKASRSEHLSCAHLGLPDQADEYLLVSPAATIGARIETQEQFVSKKAMPELRLRAAAALS
jgi:hypothetical protein